MEEVFVEDRVLHIRFYQKTLPSALDDLGTLYEGYVPGRIGVNLPMTILRNFLPSHRFSSYDADYIICYRDRDTKIHELLHAKYYMDQPYRNKVLKEWFALSDKERIKINKKLSQLGYPESVHCDEWQAYGKVIP